MSLKCLLSMKFNHRLDLQKGSSWGELDLDSGEHRDSKSEDVMTNVELLVKLQCMC